MFENKMEQVDRINFNLQLFADEGPGGDLGTPPATAGDANVGSAGDANVGQAVNTPPNGSNQPTNQQTPEQQLQAAIQGMNTAQRERSEWVNVAKEHGFNTAEDAKAAFQAYQAMQTQPTQLIENYFSKNPAALQEILRKNFGQVFGGQEPQPASPYGDVADYDEFGNRVEKRSSEATLKQVAQQYDPRLSRVENFINQQYENGIKTKENARIPQEVQETVWSKVKEIGIPFTTIESQPWLIDGLVVNAMGGREKYEESIRTATATQTAQKLTQKVTQNNNVAPLTPGGGVIVSEANVPITDQDARLREAMRRLGVMEAAGS